MIVDKLRPHSEAFLSTIEVAIYLALGILLAATGIWTLTGAAQLLWGAIWQPTVGASAFQILDQLLLVLMIVEILHTVRTSIRSQTLVTEPFLVVGPIASIRRMLIVTLEASDLIKQDNWRAAGESVFRASLMELALLGFSC